jgi:hypothetical protein
VIDTRLAARRVHHFQELGPGSGTGVSSSQRAPCSRSITRRLLHLRTNECSWALMA